MENLTSHLPPNQGQKMVCFVLREVTSFIKGGMGGFRRAKKVVSDSIGLVDFAIGQGILFLSCPTGK